MASEALTLYQAESDLTAFLDTEEGGVSEEQQAQFALDFQEALKKTVAKRDSTGRFHVHLESIIAFSKSEVQRLTARADRFEQALGRLDKYITRTILDLPRDAKGKPAKLEGQSVTLQLRACPESLIIVDTEQVPTAYKKVTVQMAAGEWEFLCTLAMASNPHATQLILDKVSKGAIAVDKAAAKKALKSGVDVPGADLATNHYTVEVK
jgi:hypothetical protein